MIDDKIEPTAGSWYVVEVLGQGATGIRAGNKAIADCNRHVSGIRGDYSEAEANARLIAAAPDLLLELEAAVARVELANAEGNPILSAWLPYAREAIAKANGNQ